MSMQQVLDPCHVSLSQEPRQTVSQVSRSVCKFFQWIDEPPRGLAEAILIKGENPLKADGNYIFI